MVVLLWTNIFDFCSYPSIYLLYLQSWEADACGVQLGGTGFHCMGSLVLWKVLTYVGVVFLVLLGVALVRIGQPGVSGSTRGSRVKVCMGLLPGVVIVGWRTLLLWLCYIRFSRGARFGSNLSFAFGDFKVHILQLLVLTWGTWCLFYIHENCLSGRTGVNPTVFIELKHPVTTTRVVVAVFELYKG